MQWNIIFKPNTSAKIIETSKSIVNYLPLKQPLLPYFAKCPKTRLVGMLTLPCTHSSKISSKLFVVLLISFFKVLIPNLGSNRPSTTKMTINASSFLKWSKTTFIQSLTLSHTCSPKINSKLVVVLLICLFKIVTSILDGTNHFIPFFYSSPTKMWETHSRQIF